ncbi:methyltransferase domain-containing protein [Arthrobacter sp. AL08]|uniref:methyltransferase domain-containing protein n=1 Tax=Micrococcaceae TaxID=1268 RepID=UPI001D00168B|nr:MULTISPECIES: methyltransferase domain-containing protein [Micrococcaceae]MCB5283262.1 23S rRNA (guanine(748)-N(1))-methyltransferase [Arthrobacter sp. ES1]MDI3241758.1 methyltransferase domain-containing protein [Arthrobacter sp. AL05]MDI3277918.1 methyltransferase domain-containing protein [Arthrobacter sp. AL08]MDJ0351708.1 methyltransferase domain-containing protein [Pseudarthrobacter sp. PH31-O2]WGZ81155.1 methyltransferase domain-containing protein [Arthrobacter sp. EM1]
MPPVSPDLLLCPVCRARLAPGGPGVPALKCPAGHSFDAAKQGYFNFLVGKGTVFEADSADMVAARFEFLGAGHYRPLADAVAELSARFLAGVDPQTPPVVLDAGTGTGHYLRAVLDQAALDRTPARAIGLDISKFALRRAAKLNPEAVNLVSDVWQPLPLGDGSVDVITVVFAPRNPNEFVRVLRPVGRLIVVTPRPGHLQEVAGQSGMLGIEPTKDERLAASLEGHFSTLSTDDLDVPLLLSPDDVLRLALMGPAGHHLNRDALLAFAAGLPPRTAVSARFRISVFEPRAKAADNDLATFAN